MTLAGALTLYLDAKAAENLRKTTIGGYKRILAAFVDWAGGRGVDDLEQLTPAEVRAWLTEILQTGRTGTTAREYRTVLLCWVTWLYREGVMAKAYDWQWSVRQIHIDRPDPQCLTPAQCNAVLAAAAEAGKRDVLVGLRNPAIVSMLLDTGLRKSELTNANLYDLDLVNRQLRVSAGCKGRRSRVVFFGEATAALLVPYLARRAKIAPSAQVALWIARTGERLSQQRAYMLIREAGDRCGINCLHPHALRHSAATNLLRNGVGLSHVQRLLGHSSPDLTARYTHLLTEDLQAAYRDGCPVDSLQKTA